MNRSNLKYLFLSVGLFIALILFQHYSPKPIDWRITFDKNHKAPYGCYILNRMYPELFGDSVYYNTGSLYDNPLLKSDATGEKNLVIITSNFSPDQAELDAIYDFLDKGNNVFISAFYYGNSLLDTLSLKTKHSTIDTAYLKSGTDVLNLYNPQLKKDSGYVFNKRLVDNYLVPKDSCKATLLGCDRLGRVNFVSFKNGEGRLFIHSQPLAFTNIHVLYSDAKYATNALSYLPEQTTIIDRYYKPYRVENNSPTKFILSQTPLRTAFYLILVMLIVYMVFGSRRKQKAIPVIEPLKNTSLEFIRTVGRLYYKSENHANIAQKKSIFFKEFLRDKYFIQDVSEDAETIAFISNKTGVPKELVKHLVHKVNYFEHQNRVSKPGLMAYHQDMEEFYKSCL